MLTSYRIRDTMGDNQSSPTLTKEKEMKMIGLIILTLMLTTGCIATHDCGTDTCVSQGHLPVVNPAGPNYGGSK
jgi:hypothetical protein